jgi:uncharacterized phage protein (TIGR01671 family)
MREIKYRGWNKKYSMWIYGESNFSFEAGVSKLNLSAFFKRVSIGEVDEDTVGEFIGRKDSNCTDLYEGDVIYDHVGRGVIKWWEANNAFKVSYVDENKGYGKWFADYNLKELESILKVGNIHQNKELL